MSATAPTARRAGPPAPGGGDELAHVGGRVHPLHRRDDQYIVRGSSNQIKAAFGVGDTQIGLLFSAFILVNGIVTLPAGYLADR